MLQQNIDVKHQHEVNIWMILPSFLFNYMTQCNEMTTTTNVQYNELFCLSHKFTRKLALDRHVGDGLLRMRTTCLECSLYPTILKVVAMLAIMFNKHLIN